MLRYIVKNTKNIVQHHLR